MRYLFAVLIALFVMLQYKLWFSTEGLAQTMQLKSIVAQQQAANQQLLQSNQHLSSAIQQLQSNQAGVETLARQNLGMIKNDETYYQFVTPAKQS